MNMSWLGDLFGKLLGLFKPLGSIKHWKIWVEMEKWYKRFKAWRDWYKQHIMAPMQQMQKLQRQLYDKYMRPLLTVVDHIRRITSIVGIFNKKLANKLNYQFLKIEGYLLEPFNKMTSRVNMLGRAFQGILTPLGYLDRATLLNSVWRDAGLIKQVLHNPFNQHPAAATAPPAVTVGEVKDNFKLYTSAKAGPYAADIQKGVDFYKQLNLEG